MNTRTRFLMSGIAAAALCGFMASCSHDTDTYQPTNEEKIANAEEKLGVKIDPNQDWKMTATATAVVTVDIDYGETYTVKVYSNDPLVDKKGYILAKGEINNGDTFTKEFEYAAADTKLVVGVTSSKGFTIYKHATIADGELKANFGGGNAAATRGITRSETTPAVPHITIPTDGYAKSFLEGAKEPTDANTTDNADNSHYEGGQSTWVVDVPESWVQASGGNWNWDYSGTPGQIINNWGSPSDEDREWFEENCRDFINRSDWGSDSWVDAWTEIYNKLVDTGRSSWMTVTEAPHKGGHVEEQGHWETSDSTWVEDEDFVLKFKITGNYDKGINVLATEENETAGTKARTVYISGKWTVAGPYGSTEQRVGGGAVIVVDNGGELNIPDGILMNFVNEARLVVMPGGKITGGGTIQVTNGNAEGAEGFNGGDIEIGTFNNNFGKFYNYGNFRATNLKGGAGLSNFYNHGVVHIEKSGKAETWGGIYDTANTRIYNACQWYCEKDMRAYVVENVQGSYFYVGGELMMSDGEDGDATNSYVALASGALMRLGSLWNVGTSWVGPTDGYAVLEVGKANYFTWDDDGPVTKGYFINNIAITVDDKDNYCQGKSTENAYKVFAEYVADGIGTNGNTNEVGNGGVIFVEKYGANVSVARSEGFEAGEKGCTPGYDGVPGGNTDTGTGETPDPDPTPDPEQETITETKAVWSYAFEDTPLGDYDMNDVVIKVSENEDDEDKLDVTLCCTGASFDLRVYLNNTVIFNGKEVHDAMGQSSGSLVNTGHGPEVDAVVATIDKPYGFSFADADFWIESPAVPGGVHITRNPGEEPHGVVIPQDWAWPLEYVCIKEAYPMFAEFAADASTVNEAILAWYKTPATGRIYKK